GASKGVAVPASGALGGPDNGLTFGPDGKLYIPGYDTNNVLRWDPATGSSQVFITPGSGGLRKTRNVLFEPEGAGVLVSSEGSAQILRYRMDGSFDKVFANLAQGVNGMDYADDGKLLVTGTGNFVERLDPGTGARIDTLVRAGDGGLSGATFVKVLSDPAPTVD